MFLKNYEIKTAIEQDIHSIYNVYKKAAAQIGGLARRESEITLEYITYFSQKSKENGLQFVCFRAGELVAEVHCYQLQPIVFQHVLSELTIAIRPDEQGKGVGRLLFQTMLDHIAQERKDILRVELITRESNERAIKLYQSLGFKREGRLENRISNGKNGFEADIPMAWFNPNFTL